MKRVRIPKKPSGSLSGHNGEATLELDLNVSQACTEEEKEIFFNRADGLKLLDGRGVEPLTFPKNTPRAVRRGNHTPRPTAQ